MRNIKILPFLFVLSCAGVQVRPASKPIELVFRLEVYKYGILQGNGTAFIIKQTNNTAYIITNRHICRDEDAEYVLVDANLARYDAHYFVAHNTADLCLLKIYGRFNPIQVSFASPQYGERIISIGAPHGAFPIVKTGSVKQIVVFNSVVQNFHYFFAGYYLRLDVEEGSSGSPVFNNKNEIIGIVFATIDGKLSCMIPSRTIQDFIKIEKEK